MPDWSDAVRRRLAGLSLRPEREAEIAEEMAEHLADRYAELRTVLGDHDAEQAVLAELSDALVGDLKRAAGRRPDSASPIGAPGGGQWWASVANDIRHSLRGFRHTPAFSLVAIATLALGIGACTLIFSAVNGILLKPLPYAAPDRLVRFWGTAPEKGLTEVDMPEGLAVLYREQSRTLEHVAAFGSTGFNLTGTGDAERIDGTAASLDFFRVLGVAPLLGRTPTAGEDTPNGVRVAVISHALWQRRFNGDSAVVGRTIDLNDAPATVIGVMPADFDMPIGTQIWVPLSLDPTDFNCWCYEMVGRMKPGVSAADVRREIERITDDFGLRRRDVFPDARRGGARFVAMPLAERIVGSMRRPLLVLLGAVGCVLLIVCANIANLLLARTAGRSRELAVRCCLGASRARIAAQLLTESVLLSLIGGAVGSLLALWGVQALRRLPVALFPRIDAVGVDGVVLAVTIGVATLTGIACGVASAIRATRVDLQDAIKSGTRASGSRATRRLSDAFVVVQFALSLMLLASAGLLVRSYLALSHVDAGYRTHDVVVARVQLSYPRYDGPAVLRGFYGRLLERLRAVRGVQAAGLVSRVPLSNGNPQDNVVAEGQEPRPGEAVRVANVRTVDEDYFDAIGTPLVRGRHFTASDNEHAPRVAIVDEAFAKHFWPAGDALGRRFRHRGDTSSNRWLTVVGIVQNVKHSRLDETPDLQEYEAFAQRPNWMNYVVVRTTLADGIVSRIRREVRALDPLLPVYDAHTMESAVDRSLSTRHLTNTLLVGFSVAALLLAAIGVYGVISIGVTARRREFGIRVALGANLTDLGMLILRQGVRLALIGVAAGLVGAFWTTHAVRGMLYGVGPFDWITFAAVALLLVMASLVASYLPARRASRADPMLALRSE